MKILSVAIFTVLCGFSVANAANATTMSSPDSPIDVPCWEQDEASESDESSPSGRRCVVLQGDDAEREQFAQWASAAVEFLPSDGEAIDILHSVAGWTTPAVRTPVGIEIITVQAQKDIPLCTAVEGASSNEESEHPLPELEQAAARLAEEQAGPSPLYALVSLSPSFAAHCGTEQLWLGAGDALGRFGRILRIDARGLLVLHEEALVWLPGPQSPPPIFRMTWRSGFIVQMEQAGASASKSSTTKSTSKKTPTSLKARTAPRTTKKRGKIK